MNRKSLGAKVFADKVRRNDHEKTIFCIFENKEADQLRGPCAAD